jgi:nicotinamide-nucleotide amidase
VHLIVCSGGLGPTDDDVTREVVAEVLGRPLREDVAITEKLRARFAARFSGPMPEINRRQAMVPEGAVVLENSRGSAPGLWIEDGARVVLLLPGPPRELKPMLASVVDGPLKTRAAGVSLARRILKIAGRIESKTEEDLQPIYAAWAAAPVKVEATILAALGQLELHLSTRTPQRDQSEAALEGAVADVVAALGADVFSTDGRSLEEVVGAVLAARGLTIGIAESCTGGLITSRLTDVPGSSRYVERSVVTYSNTAKTDLLGVPEPLLAAHGAVSDPVARAMAAGIRARAGVDVGVGVTGIAGPDGGTPDKPVGTVVIAVAWAGGIHSRTFHFLGERDQVKYQASQAALDMVRRLLP